MGIAPQTGPSAIGGSRTLVAEGWMTTDSVLRAVLRRWPLTLVGLALTALGVHHVYTEPSP